MWFFILFGYVFINFVFFFLKYLKWFFENLFELVMVFRYLVVFFCSFGDNDIICDLLEICRVISGKRILLLMMRYCVLDNFWNCKIGEEILKCELEYMRKK